MKKIGLIVGKFAPLHKGHEFLLKSAAEAVDRLIVLVYDASDITRVPLSVRAGWIRAAFPDVEVLEGYNSPPRDGWTLKRMREHEEFIKQFVSSFHITHVFSGEEYGEMLAHALGAEHVRIGKIKEGTGDLSATMIRNHPEARRFLNEKVYRDMQKYEDML